MNKPKCAFGLTALSLVSGSMIYVLLRPDSILAFRWLDALGLSRSVVQLRRTTYPAIECLPGWFIFSLEYSDGIEP